MTAGIFLLIGGVAVGGWMSIGSAVDAKFAKTWESHEVDFPVPFPLSEAEVEALRTEKAAELPEDAPEDADPSRASTSMRWPSNGPRSAASTT